MNVKFFTYFLDGRGKLRNERKTEGLEAGRLGRSLKKVRVFREVSSCVILTTD